MRTWITKKMLSRFEQRYKYSVDYMVEMLDHTPATFFKFGKFVKLAQHRSATPLAPYFAAKIVGSLSEDCGPCTQLAVDFARDSHVPASQLKAVLSGDRDGMTDEVRLAYDFAQALCTTAADLSELRAQVGRRWGVEGVIDLSMVVATARVFPVLKRGMGHAEACLRVDVEGEPVPATQPT